LLLIIEPKLFGRRGCPVSAKGFEIPEGAAHFYFGVSIVVVAVAVAVVELWK
jgi:hypothetical protein